MPPKMKSTKDLARELGLIRKRTLKQRAGGSKDKSKAAQEFLYLIVIDFESTCWKDKKNPSQEIIEFPAVLMNTSTGLIEDEFHTYCLPEEHPTLSAFCTELTGITQAQVESGIPLFLCLKKFCRWLKQLETDRAITFNTSSTADAKLCTFVTWSDWDLGVCLHYECRRKQLLKPEALKCWIDLRATYRKFYQRVPNGLAGALKDLGIQFEGRQHSGLDDARNTANLAWRMICDGCQMKITKNISSASGQKKSSSVAPICQKKVLTSAPCQFSSKRKAPSSTKALESLTASPVLPTKCKRSGSSSTFTTSTDSHTHISNENSGNVFQTPRVLQEIGIPCKCAMNKISDTISVPLGRISGSRFISPQVLGTNIPSKSAMNTIIDKTVPVDKTPSCSGAQSETPARLGELSTASKIMSHSTSSDARNQTHQRVKPNTLSTLNSKNIYKTPDPQGSTVKITPPLCHCGKRSRRRNVFSPGPNQGRTFYSCCGRRRHGNLKDVSNYTGGCEFFKWESVLIKTLGTLLTNKISNSV